jgi:hypothetical protein
VTEAEWATATKNIMSDLLMCMGIGLLVGSVPMLLYDFAAAIMAMLRRKVPFKERLELFATLAGMGGCALGLLGGVIGILIGLAVGTVRILGNR